MLAGVLVFGTPAGVLAEDVDHSMEGQISKPQSSGESDTDSFVDDSTDNTMDIIRSWGVPQWMWRIWWRSMRRRMWSILPAF